MQRIYHRWEKWECYPAGFYGNKPPKGMTKEDCEIKYGEMLSDQAKFSSILDNVINDWIYSCEHYLTNVNMNRLAWLGQAALCYEYGIPACFRTGFYKMRVEDQDRANATALNHLNRWLENNGHNTVTEDSVKSKTKANLY